MARSRRRQPLHRPHPLRDKHDLFLSDIEGFFDHTSTLLTRTNAPARRIAPVREVFTHVAEVRDFHAALIASGKWPNIRELGQGYFAAPSRDA